MFQKRMYKNNSLKMFIFKKLMQRWVISETNNMATSNPQGFKVDAEEVAEPFRKQIVAQVSALLEKHKVTPVLVGFLANNDRSARKYAQWTKRACEKDGIDFQLRECETLELEGEIQKANQDPKVHGILIYYPCFGSKPSYFGGKMDDYLRDSVCPEKDVEGLCFTYRHNLYHDIRFIKRLNGSVTEKKCLLPCTPLAIVKTLEALGAYQDTGNQSDGDQKRTRLEGKVVTIINRSEIVGRPLSAMLANDLATVYSIDINSIYMLKDRKMMPVSKDLSVDRILEMSDIVITGVPTKDYQLNTECIQPGTVIMNVSHYKNVDEKKLEAISGVRYVPLIGKVTVAMLERNLLRLIENFHLPGNKCKLIEAGGRIDPYFDEPPETS